MKRIYITVQGGIVQGVASDTPEDFKDVEVVIVDFDIEGADEERLTNVTSLGGDVNQACISEWDVWKNVFKIEGKQ